MLLPRALPKASELNREQATVRNECTFTGESVHLLLVFDLLAPRAGELITRDIVLVERGFQLDIDSLMIIPFVALERRSPFLSAFSFWSRAARQK